MTWVCPACLTEIRHQSADRLPDPRDDYRCHVCRLDLRFDSASRKVVVAPLDTRQTTDEPPRGTPRSKR